MKKDMRENRDILPRLSPTLSLAWESRFRIELARMAMCKLMCHPKKNVKKKNVQLEQAKTTESAFSWRYGNGDGKRYLVV